MGCNPHSNICNEKFKNTKKIILDFFFFQIVAPSNHYSHKFHNMNKYNNKLNSFL